jgi:DNA-binding response OmpR family regulator
MARILVIDADKEQATFISRALIATGFAVDKAYEGRLGLKMARSRGYSLVLLEPVLPDVNGLSVLRGIVESEHGHRAFVVSVVSDVESKIRCLDLGASDYLAKPFALAELLARVRARLRESPSPAADRWLPAGRFRLDLQLRVADLGERKISLSPHEFFLVKHLAERGLSTRPELLADVWGYSFDPGTNVVDVCVRRLRSKLGGQMIETVRNVGYRLS